MDSLIVKYRPKTFDTLYGNTELKASLEGVLGREASVPHAIFLQGPSGCGKTTVARIIATSLGCVESEILEYNTSNTRGIDTIRDIAAQCQFKPLRGDIRVYLLDEVHKLTNDAQNAILKLLEEPPSFVYFILCTTDPEKVLKTIRTRCVMYRVELLNSRVMHKFISDIFNAEGADAPGVLVEAISKSSLGSPRQALTLIDQVLDLTDLDQAVALVKNSIPDETKIIDICRAMMDGKKWEYVAPLLDTLAGEPEQNRYAILGYLSSVMLKKPSDVVANLMLPFTESFMYSGKAGLILAVYFALRR